MPSISDTVFYALTFLSVYVQVFFFITFLENRKKIIIRKGPVVLSRYPAVTITVPIFNEERTLEKTVESLLTLDYPKDKLRIFLVNDGSTDSTPAVMQKFAGCENIKIFHKPNGGKYTALNLGLANMETEFFGCLDADSFADPQSLARIMSYFERDPSVMAVAPSITVVNSKNFIQSAQRAEYYMGVYFKKMLGFMGAIDVTPGPLTIFRKKVFEELGEYRHGHNTEDMEIAYRMQKNHYKIEHCNDAYVYTNTPGTVRKLYRQRLRWIFGFINNTLDYRKVLLKKKYGNFSVFVLPTRIASVVAVGYVFGRLLYNFADFIYSKVIFYKAVGLHLGVEHLALDPFFINTQALLFLIVLTYSLIFFSMLFGRKMAEDKWSFSPGMLYFFPVFTIVGPFWLLKAVYNTLLKRTPSWR